MSSLFYDGRLMEIGKAGEDMALRFLTALPHTDLQDVRDDPYWQQLDVDFRLTRRDRTVVNVEAKSDRHIANTGNVLFELTRIHHASSAVCAYTGWSVFSEAQRLLVWCPPAERMYVFSMAVLRAGMQAYTHETRQSMRLSIVTTDELRTTFNVLVPLAYVQHKVYCLNEGTWKVAS